MFNAEWLGLYGVIGAMLLTFGCGYAMILHFQKTEYSINKE